ncbi:unnamed protein product [Parascedosporium putredinis]|uniref:Carboxylesterase type B domain-containing protein n=1 Tax=Parascedosporium putredinis TaxID=1442378 RepID=A0A9P1MDS3_9PEZI|nr:unnamed protein product [Parascedosporium putredinis]CAI8001148.1 unnamed protein product [Parascedosporium putredinis]
MPSERRQPPQVTLRQGVYRGKYLASTRIRPKALDVFLGIPYAQERAGGIKLPVLVYVHGGAFNMGFGADRDLASFVAHAKRDVVAVSFNYRLGVLGFLAAADGPDGARGLNLGLRDQRVAMEWLGHHILSYPPNSAPSSAPSSNPAPPPPAPSGTLPTRAKRRNSPNSLPPPASPDTAEDPFPALRALSVADLTTAAARVWRRYADSVRWPFQPVIDGADIVPDRPLALWDAATQFSPNIPIITGFCSHEGTAFPADLDRLDALYPLHDPDADPDCPRTPADRGPHWARLQAAYAHYAYIAPVLYTAHRLSLLPAPPPFTSTTPSGLVDVSTRMHAWFADFVSADPAPVLDGWPVFQCPLRGGPEAAKIMVFGRGNDERIPPEDGGRGSTGVSAEVRTMTAREVEQIKFWWDRTALSQGFGERDPA